MPARKPATNKAKLFFRKIWGEAVFIVLITMMIEVNINLCVTLKQGDQNLLQNFIEWYAVIYTLVLSVVVGQAWKKHNNINREIDREADALVLLAQTGRMFEHEDDEIWGKALFLAVKSYLASMIVLQASDRRLEGEAYEKMKSIREYVELLIQNGHAHGCLKTELLHQYHDAFDARGDRFDLLEQKLPNHVWVVFVVVSLIWLWGFLLLEFDSTIFKFYVLGATILSISYLFYLARDLDDPSKGVWRMDFISLEKRIFDDLTI